MDKHDLQVELALEAEAIGWLLLSSPEPGAAAGGGGGGKGGMMRQFFSAAMGAVQITTRTRLASRTASCGIFAVVSNTA